MEDILKMIFAIEMINCLIDIAEEELQELEDSQYTNVDAILVK